MTTRSREVDQYLAGQLIGEEFDSVVWARLDELGLIPDGRSQI